MIYSRREDDLEGGRDEDENIIGVNYGPLPDCVFTSVAGYWQQPVFSSA